MKINWGTGIAIVLSLFAISMGYAVYKAVQQNYDLVTDDYYAEELAYQDRIDQKRNALVLEDKASILLSEAGILIQIPQELKGKTAEMQLEMYCVTEADNDFKTSQIDWAVDDIAIPREKLSSGRWTAKLTLDVDGKGYYFDPQVLIP